MPPSALVRLGAVELALLETAKTIVLEHVMRVKFLLHFLPLMLLLFANLFVAHLRALSSHCFQERRPMNNAKTMEAAIRFAHVLTLLRFLCVGVQKHCLSSPTAHVIQAMAANSLRSAVPGMLQA